MYSIRKFADCWAVFNLDTDKSRALTEEEAATATKEFPDLADPKTVAHYADKLDCLKDLP